MARRLLDSFCDAMESNGPGTWFSSPKAEVHERHLAQDGPRVRELAGTLVSQDGSHVTIRPDDGSASIVLERDRWSSPSHATFSRWGDLATGRPWPMAHSPPERDLIGRRVLIVRYERNHERIAWLRPRSR